MFGLVPFKINNNFIDSKNKFDNMFKDFFGDEMSMKNLRVDIREKENEYILEADFPGMKKEDINIDYIKGYLTISGEKKTEKEETEKKENYIRKERSYEKASRSFYVGDINKDEIKAKFENGVLEITIPKEQKTIQENSRIEIK
ncbi:MAG: Hsp20/alpha crystallin family protein [Clostridium sp.]